MPERLLIVGGTGLAGSTVAMQALRAGWDVHALVRDGAMAGPLQDAGVRIVAGDVTQPNTLVAAMKGVTDVVNCAATLSGAWSTATPQQMWAVNHRGALNVLDAARATGVRRCVHLDTRAIWDAEHTLTERSTLLPRRPTDSPYVHAKRVGYVGALYRAALGQHIVFVTPGAIYGPGPLLERSLDATSWTRVALKAITGELTRFVSYPMLWAYVRDVAEVVLAALAQGEPGRRYLALGREEDVSSLAGFCNTAAQIAGSPHRVRDIAANDPNAPDIGTMRQFADRVYASPLVDPTTTTTELGVTLTPRDAALRETVAWLRANGKLIPNGP